MRRSRPRPYCLFQTKGSQLGSVQLEPHTTVVPGSPVPHTTVPLSFEPQTSVLLSLVDHVVPSGQSAPPHADPQTTSSHSPLWAVAAFPALGVPQGPHTGS